MSGPADLLERCDSRIGPSHRHQSSRLADSDRRFASGLVGEVSEDVESQQATIISRCDISGGPRCDISDRASTRRSLPQIKRELVALYTTLIAAESVKPDDISALIVDRIVTSRAVRYLRPAQQRSPHWHPGGRLTRWSRRPARPRSTQGPFLCIQLIRPRPSRARTPG